MSAMRALYSPEPYIGRIELARQLGVHVRTVDRLVREGLPSETWGLRTRKFKLSEARRWLRDRERGTA